MSGNAHGGKMKITVISKLVLLPFLAVSTISYASDSYQKMHDAHHGTQQSGGHHGGGMHKGAETSSGHQHDTVNMPGLKGVDTTDQEISDLKNIFTNHKRIRRTVENLPNGIRTITETDDEALRESVVTHVALMVTRLEEGRNPQVMIQSPTLDLLFDKYDEVDTIMEMTERGVEVIQTSANSEVVGLLQQHAAEVTDMSRRGMAAVHERMMRSQ